MSNVFERMMNNTSNEMARKSASGGRPMHDSWLGFEKNTVDGKVTARCLNCLKTLQNTHQARMSAHR